MKHYVLAPAGVFLYVALFSPALRADVPRTIAFQGILTNAARVPLPDGTYPNVTFRLYDHLSGPTQLWIETKPVVVAGGHGVFATALGSATPIPASVAFDQPYWLSVQVGADAEMSPRLPLGAAPYALSLPLPFAGSSSSLSAGLAITNSGSGYGVSGSGSSGVFGVSTSPTGAGVSGQSAAGGDGIGVYGGSANGRGVVGVSNPRGAAGVYGESADGAGVEGNSVNGAGVAGQSDGTGEAGIFATGVYGQSANGTGVDGNSAYGTGVRGASGSGNGVQGEARSPNGFALYGRNIANGPSVGSYYQPGANGVGLFAGDWGWFGSAAIETDLTGPGTHIYCAENGTGVFYVFGGGAVHALSYANLSDARYKQDIQTVGNPLATVGNLRGVSFEWNPGVGRSFPKGRQIGFVAQEVRKVLPELVSEDEKGYLSVEYANVVPVLVEAIKQQQAQIAAADLANACMQARLRHLEQQVQSMATGTPYRTRR